MSFKFLQPINTPRGPGHFIGYIGDGRDCQVTLWVQRDGKKICINPFFAVGQISERISTDHGKIKPANKIIPVDVASI